jgi:hypothetical protein
MFSIVETITVTHADVLYVSGQITRDLRKWHEIYPKLVSADRVLSLNDAMTIFLSNDAVAQIGFSVEDPDQQHLVLHELRYEISYTGFGPRTGRGGAANAAAQVPATATMTPWVVWSRAMLSLSAEEQRSVLEGTGWSIPGTHTFNARYVGGHWTSGPTYSSGVLSAESQQYRARW